MVQNASKLVTVFVVGTHFLVLVGLSIAIPRRGEFPTENRFTAVQLLHWCDNYDRIPVMTFLRWYGLGAVGLTMIVTCLGLELALLLEPLFAHGFQKENHD